MQDIPDAVTLCEMIEDDLEAATGEPRHVTDIEIAIIPEQGERNWSADAKCKPVYRKPLMTIIGEYEARFPQIEFGT